MNNRTTHSRPKASANARPPDELEVRIRRLDRRRKIFAIIVLAPLVAALVITSVYTFTPFAAPGDDSGARSARGQIAELEEVVREHPKDLEALIALGNHYYDARRFEDASKTYRRALAIDPVNPDVQTDYGTSLLYQNRTPEAIAAYQKTLETHPRHVNARVNLGVAYHAIGQDDKAAAAWHDALALTEDQAIRQKVKDLLKTLGQPK